MSADGAMPLPAAAASAARHGRLELDFELQGGETRLARQFISYPFHLTRPFRLDRQIPALITLYQQSASGGLYRGDDLATRLRLGPGASVHVTTQSATIVHDCRGEPARQETEIEAGPDAFLALTPDAQILLPGAASRSRTTVTLAEDAVVLLAESFSPCVPAGARGAFDRLENDVVARRPGGPMLLRDCFLIGAADLDLAGFAAGGFAVCASFLLLGDTRRLPDAGTLAPPELPGAVAGISRLPNDLGWGVRALASSARTARIMAAHIFAVAVQAALGAEPAPRRK